MSAGYPGGLLVVDRDQHRRARRRHVASVASLVVAGKYGARETEQRLRRGEGDPHKARGEQEEEGPLQPAQCIVKHDQADFANSVSTDRRRRRDHRDTRERELDGLAPARCAGP